MKSTPKFSARSSAVRTLMLSPEPPYPLNGGGAYRTASLLHYLARVSEPELILISDSGWPALLPEGLVCRQRVVGLPHHRRDVVSRYLRNARRAIRGVPPLMDRVGGLDKEIKGLLNGGRWDLAIVEHFWCAPYVDLLRGCCNRMVLDLHNVESVLHERCAEFTRGLVQAGHRRFAASSRKLEAELLPRFSLVLTASESDAALVRRIAPSARVSVYPNALPGKMAATSALRAAGKAGARTVVFSGNFEYHPNIDAVEFLVRAVWPAIRRSFPDLRMRLVGRGDQFIRHLLPAGDSGIETTGRVEDAFAEIARADVVLAPLRIGSGTRLKIVEAWAAGRAVVATPLAAEGLEAADGENIRLAGDAAGLAAAVGELLNDPRFVLPARRRGKSDFESLYCWEAVWKNPDLDAQLTTDSALNGYTENNELMRIAVDAHAIRRHLTGNEVYVRSLLRGFAEIDQESEFIACISEREAAASIPARFRVRYVSSNPYRRLGWDLARLVRAEKPDLVHVQYTTPLFCSVPAIVTVHDVSFIEHPEYFTSSRSAQLKFTVQRSVNGAARVITVSEFSRQAILRAYDISPDKVVAIPNAASPEFRAIGRDKARRRCATGSVLTRHLSFRWATCSRAESHRLDCGVCQTAATAIRS